jgi:hypothetical protein
MEDLRPDIWIISFVSGVNHSMRAECKDTTNQTDYFDFSQES